MCMQYTDSNIAHHYLPFMSRYNADIKPIPLPNEFPRFTSENVAFRA